MGSTEMDLLNRVSEQCGTTNITPDGKEKPLISPAELMTLRKSFYHKETLYLNLAKSIRYMTTLPSIEAYEMGDCAAPNINVKHPKVKAYSMFDLLNDISNDRAKIPFSEKEYDYPDQNKTSKKSKSVSKKNKNNSTYNNADEDTYLSEELRAELEQKFDEIFVQFDSNEE